MDKELHCDFYITQWKANPFKQMDFNNLKNLKRISKNIKLIGRFYWQKNAVKQIFKPYHYYILIGDPSCVSTWVILFLSFFFKKKTILWSHGWYGKESNIESLIKRIFFSLADDILLYGNYAKKLMINEGFNESRLHVIYNSLDYNSQLSIRNTLKPSNIFSNKFQNNYHNIIFIGRLTDIKRIDLLLFALFELRSQKKYFNLTIIGDGIKKNELVDLVKRLQLTENIWFYGESYNEQEISKLIFNADLCVSPGNVGLTAIHSLVYGTPVITHNDLSHQMPEFEAIEDNISGTFFTKNDYFALAESIANWFSKCQDRELVRKNCYQVIDNKYNPYFQIEVLKNIVSH